MREKVREKERGKVETAPVAFDGLGVRRKRKGNDALSVFGEFRYVEGAENRLDSGFADLGGKKWDRGEE